MKKKVVAMVLGAAMVMSMAACGGGKTADTTTAAAADAGAGTTAAVSGAVNTDDLPEVTLTLGSSAASSNDTYQVMVDLEKEVEEKTGGKLKINVVWDRYAGRRWRVGGELHGRKRGYGILGIFSVAGIFPGDRGI